MKRASNRQTRFLRSSIPAVAAAAAAITVAAEPPPPPATGAQSTWVQRQPSRLVRELEGIFLHRDFASIPDRRFDPRDFGATGDGRTLDTAAIQQAIDAATDAGGGVVSVPPGEYLSGALFVKSNVELHLEEGAVIRAIQDDNHYPEHWTRIAGVEMEWPAALVNVYQQKNVRITGPGTIDGNGKYWWDKFWGDPPRSGGMYQDYTDRGLRWAVDYDCKRVRAVVVYDAEQVLLRGFTVLRSGFWAVTMTYCDQVHVDGLTIRNNVGGFGPSSDGVNTDSSRNILVENCDIDCNDDTLCLKAGKDADGLRVNRPTERVVYRNCITRAGHGLFTLGSETAGGMHDIEVYGLRAVGTSTGIRFKSAKVRGGVIRDIWIHDIEMIDVDNPFRFELNWYPAYSYPTIPENIPESEINDRWRALTRPVEPPERGIPEFRNITFSNISVKNADEAIFVNAYPEKPMRDMHWENITIHARKPGVITSARDWTMNNVTLLTPAGTPPTLEDCHNLELPWLPPTSTATTPTPTPKEQPHILGL